MADLKMGVSRSLLGERQEWPVHGLRHRPEADTTGWYCWTGELSADPEFFLPLHEAHFVRVYPDLAAYLALPPGSRFIVGLDYVDVWDDPSLLDT